MIPQLNTTTSAIYAHYERVAADGLRDHLGASIIGHHCARYLWLKFRWVDDKKFEGRMLRLFETGQLEEPRLVANLRAIGCEVSECTAHGNQHEVRDETGHIGGSMDAIARGFPEAHAAWHICEFKTFNTKDFKQLQDRGVADVKPMHYAQMTTYMGLRGYDRAAYLAKCKETDELYFERIHFDGAEFDRLMKRATAVVKASEPPERCSTDATWWQCKMCDFHGHCHGTAAPLVNCRTCAHATPVGNGEWSCARGQEANPKQGCGGHRFIPILLRNFAEMTDANAEDNWVQYRNVLTGKTFWNGDLSSQEIRDCEDKRMLGDEGMNQFRYEFGAKVVA